MEAQNAVLNVIFQRKSIRKFKKRQISRKVIETIVAAGQRAPTACGMQAYSFVLVSDPKTRQEIYSAIGRQKCMEEAPTWIIVCADFARQFRFFELLGIKTSFGGVSRLVSTVIDAALTVENMVIVAESLGVGSVCIGSIWDSMKQVSEILGLPRHVLPIVLLCLGYPDESPPTRPRWPLKAVLHENRYEMPPEKLMKEYYEEANKSLVEMGYFPKGIANWAEHWRRKFNPDSMDKWEKKLRQDLQDLGFL